MSADKNSSRLQRTQPGPQTGIVHLGLGAFFRAHAAIYLKEAIALAKAQGSDSDWGVVGVSLRSASVRNKLVPQDCLYTAVEVSATGLSIQMVDVVTNVLVAPENPAAVLQVMSSAATKIVSLTVTEKGYCRGSGTNALDFNHPDIIHDLNNEQPRSAPGYLVRALEMRWRNGLRPFTVLSLDNLPANGKITGKIVTELAQRLNPELACWIETECRFPCTMVDRIVPATTDAFTERVQVETGLYDSALVIHEPFRQWVIEDDFVDGEKPQLEEVGAQLVKDVEPYEHMKLRMLNGPHSALAYMGSLAGHTTVADAMSDPQIASFLDSLWQENIIPSLQAPEGTNLTEYAATLKSRFQNPEIRHLLEQITMDGSQKLPQRILDPLFENRAAGRPYQHLLRVVAEWLQYLQVRAESSDSVKINDPLANELVAAVSSAENDQQRVNNLLSIQSVFGKYPAEGIAGELLAALQHSGG